MVGSPTSNRSAADLGESVTFEANASGGSGSLNYSWQGLPARCTGTTGPTPSCVVSTTGILTVWPIVTDAAGGSVASAGTVSLLVYSDPKASAPTVSPGAPVQGSSMTIQTIVLGGSGNESFVWSGLPPGCHGTTAVVTCSPSSSGSFSVSVAVRDSTGFRTLSPTTVITVASPLAAPFGIPAPLFYGGLGGAVIAVALAVVWFRRRRTPRAPSEAPTEPDPLEVAEPADLPD
ncbi:MAG TPA: hypothetical protein VGV64_04925 [Thermoplasmata archaeon]|nr:hypothetical protein [Thermoplasmata archaeon]